MKIEDMLICDFIQLATNESNVMLARAKCISKGKEVDPEETHEESQFWNGVHAFKAELEQRGNFIQ